MNNIAKKNLNDYQPYQIFCNSCSTGRPCSLWWLNHEEAAQDFNPNLCIFYQVAIPLLMRFKLVILRKASSQNLLSFITNIDPSKKQCNVPSVIFNPVILLGLWACPPVEWACVISETFYLAPAHDLLVPNILLSCICLPVEIISFEQ